jgi:hypothetical protein
MSPDELTGAILILIIFVPFWVMMFYLAHKEYEKERQR